MVFSPNPSEPSPPRRLLRRKSGSRPDSQASEWDAHLPIAEPYRSTPAPPLPSQTSRRSLDRSQSSSYSNGQRSAYPASMSEHPPNGGQPPTQYSPNPGPPGGPGQYQDPRRFTESPPMRQQSQSQSYPSPQPSRGDPAAQQLQRPVAGRPPPTSSSPVSMTARSRDHGNGNGNGSTEASRQGSPYRPGQERESAQHNQLQQSASSSTPPSRSGHSPARQSQSGHNAQPPPAGGRTIAGEPLHDMGRAISLLKSSKFYAEGFLMKKVEAGPDGKPPHADNQWSKWFVQLTGTIMSTWNAQEMEDAARENRTVPPQYLNLADSFLHPYPPNPNGPPSPTQFQFALNSAGLNRTLFCTSTLESLTMWINAIRLAGWERSRCNEIYTGTLLGLREPRGGWPAPDPAKKLEGWLKARLPGDTEWRRVWVVLIRGGPAGAAAAAAAKKPKRASILSFGRRQSIDVPLVDDLPGDGALTTLAFFEERLSGKRERPLCIAQHLYYASAIFPESEQLINTSSLFKIEGTFLNPADAYKSNGWGVGGRAEKQGFALLMLDEGDSLAMLQWIIGFADAFKLYGRPRTFSYDPRDPSSLYFALPVGPHRDRQFLDRELVDTLKIDESRPRAIRAVFHNILFDRMRGIRPTALGPLPPPSGRESFEDDLRQQQDGRPDMSRRMSELPQLSQSQSGTSSPMILPPIGESGPDELEDSLPPAAFRARGDLSETPPQGSTRNSTPDYLGEAGVKTPERSDTVSSELGTYAAFVSADIAQEPPAPVVDQSFRTSTSSFSPHPSTQSPTPINTKVPNSPPPNFSRPRVADEPGTPSSVASGITHLTYAPPAAQKPYESAFYPPPQSVVYDPSSNSPHLPGSSSLPSPGAPPTVLAFPGAESSVGSQQDSVVGASAAEEEELAYLQQSPPLPDPPAQFASMSPPYRQDSDREPPIAGPSGEPSRTRNATPPAPPTPVVIPAAIPFTHAQRSLSPARAESPSARSTVSRLSEQQGHDGGVVDSPESLPLTSPVTTAYNTKPLFSPQTSTQATAGFPASQSQSGPVEATGPPPLAAPVPASGAPTASPASSSRELALETPPRQLSVQTQARMAAPAPQQSFDTPEDFDIHSDLLAALKFADRSDSPPPHSGQDSPSSTGPSPVATRHHVGPPARRDFSSPKAAPATTERAPSPVDEEYAAASPPSKMTEPAPAPAFPSTFAKNKRAEERAAAAQEAQLAQRASVTQPGRAAGKGKGKSKKGLWEDSDEEDEPEDEDDDDDDAAEDDHQRSASHGQRAGSQYDPASSPNSTRNSRALPVPPAGGYGYSQNDLHAQQSARQSYYDNGPSPDHRGSSGPPTPPETDHRDVSPGRPVARPVLSPHGLLHAGILDKEERSARAMEYQARDSGGPLVNLPSKPPPPQTGLVGALTSHQREKERTGGVGRALTEQQRERKLAEQRQKQLDDLQKAQLQQQQHQMAMMGGYGGGYNPMIGAGFNPMMYGGGMGMMPPPMSAYGMMPPISPGMGSQMGGGSQFGGVGPAPSQFGGGAPSQMGPGQSPSLGLEAQQQQAQAQHAHMMQAQAMMAAQQAYMMAMSQFQPPPAPASAAPDGSPAMHAGGLPYSGFMQPGMYPQSPFGAQGGFPGSQSFGGGSQMGGFPAGPGSSFGYNPYAQPQPPSAMFGQMNLGGEHQEQDGVAKPANGTNGEYGHEPKPSQ